MGHGVNGGEKRSVNGKTNTAEDRCWCRNSVCVAVIASLTLLPLPGQHYQNTNSRCKQKNHHHNAWNEDVLNHVQAARKIKSFWSHTSPGKQTWRTQHGAAVQGVDVSDRVCMGREGSRVGGSEYKLGTEQSELNAEEANGHLYLRAAATPLF